MKSSETTHNPELQRNLRLLAGASVVLGFAGLHVLGAQAFAVGLFTSPWDKLAHVISFGLIGAAVGLASGTGGWRRTVWCIAGAVIGGALDEWHQAYLPGRNASWMDLLADAAGGALAAALLSLEHWLVRRRT
jgi:hypothetical protein